MPRRHQRRDPLVADTEQDRNGLRRTERHIKRRHRTSANLTKLPASARCLALQQPAQRVGLNAAGDLEFIGAAPPPLAMRPLATWSR